MLSSRKKLKSQFRENLWIEGRTDLIHIIQTDRPYSALTHIPKWEWNKTNTSLFKTITNNIARFVSITWHQKEPLGCVVYSHHPTNDSYNICIHSCCLPCNYVTKPFGILQRVMKSQRVYIYHLDSTEVDSTKVDTFSLRKVRAAKFSENLSFKFQVYWKGIKNSWKKFFFFVHIGNVLTLQTADIKFLILSQIVSHSNINFLISKQSKASKNDPKLLKQ